MMDKERLECIKERHEVANASYHAKNFAEMKAALEQLFLEEDTDWLIKKAERAQELEEELRVRDNAIKSMDSIASQREDRLMSALKSKSSYRKQRNSLEIKVGILKEQNKRYRETLEKINNEVLEALEASD